MNQTYITPGCCQPPASAYGDGTLAVFLEYLDLGTDEQTYAAGEVPVWVVFAQNLRVHAMGTAPATFCPHCGKRLPPIRKRQPVPIDLCVPSEGYCRRCNQRLRACRCRDPIEQWEVAPDGALAPEREENSRILGNPS